MQILPAFRVCHVDDSALQPAEQVHALLAIRQARILGGEDRTVEHRLAAIEVQPVAAEIGLALPLVPRHHESNRSYKKLPVSSRTVLKCRGGT